MVCGEQVVRHFLDLLGSHLVDAVVEMGDVLFPAVMQKTLAEVEGKLFAIVAGNGNLPFQLTFGIAELGNAEGFLHHLIQFTAHQTETFPDIVRVTAEIDAPDTGIAITHHRTLHGIYQSVALSEGEVQTGIHAWTT